MFEFHGDRKRYYDMQVLNTEKYVLPFIEVTHPITPGMRVLEIGCGEAGVLKAFISRGCVGVGVELDEDRVRNAEIYNKTEVESGRLRLMAKDIYQVNPEVDLGGLFDIIVLKDVIEHIHDQPRLIGWMKQFLQPQGIIFFGFPPWYMPYGGHQQMCRGKISKLPYVHLLPRFMYKWLLDVNKESTDAFLEIRDTQISIEQFERISQQQGYAIANKCHYLLNPIYEWKFGWKPRKQLGIISAIPFFRNFLTTCVYYTIKPV
jgi:SAM-dependent methyltransferase